MPYKIRSGRMSFLERIYLPEVLRGLAVTARHFIGNLVRMDERITIEYPEAERRLPPGYRAEHRLMRRADGSIRCTACMLCATACPAKCIEIEAEEVQDPSIEKRAKSFRIDILRCAFCGLCVEACPCDAIRMDTGAFKNAGFERTSFVYREDRLSANFPPDASPLSCSL